MLDHTARRIIAMLQDDGRCPNTVMARELGVSEATIRARVDALRSSGVLQIVGLTDPGNMGFGVMAMIGVQATSDLGQIADLVATWPETTYVVISAGSYDILVEVVCRDNADLLRISERLRGLQGVRSTESFIYISRHKLNYAWAHDVGADTPDGLPEAPLEP